MALIKCPECGKEISDKASACPNCGYPINVSTPTPTTASTSNGSAQIRVVLKALTVTIDGKSATHGSIVEVPVTSVSGTKTIIVNTWGGDVGMIPSGIAPKVIAGHKYDLCMHKTLVGRMPYLKEVESFM